MLYQRWRIACQRTKADDNVLPAHSSASLNNDVRWPTSRVPATLTGIVVSATGRRRDWRTGKRGWARGRYPVGATWPCVREPRLPGPTDSVKFVSVSASLYSYRCGGFIGCIAACWEAKHDSAADAPCFRLEHYTLRPVGSPQEGYGRTYRTQVRRHDANMSQIASLILSTLIERTKYFGKLSKRTIIKGRKLRVKLRFNSYSSCGPPPTRRSLGLLTLILTLTLTLTPTFTLSPYHPNQRRTTILTKVDPATAGRSTTRWRSSPYLSGCKRVWVMADIIKTCHIASIAWPSSILLLWHISYSHFAANGLHVLSRLSLIYVLLLFCVESMFTLWHAVNGIIIHRQCRVYRIVAYNIDYPSYENTLHQSCQFRARVQNN